MGQLLGGGGAGGSSSGDGGMALLASLFPALGAAPAGPSPNASMPPPATDAFGQSQGFQGIAQGFQGLNTLQGGAGTPGDTSDVWDMLQSMFGSIQ